LKFFSTLAARRCSSAQSGQAEIGFGFLLTARVANELPGFGNYTLTMMGGLWHSQ
jgi:hypothetical protein